MASGLAILLMNFGLRFIQGQHVWQQHLTSKRVGFDQQLRQIEIAHSNGCSDLSALNKIQCTTVQAHWLKIQSQSGLLTWVYKP